MAHYLTITEIATECEGCAAELGPGLIGLTDDIHPDQLAPICKRCLISQDRRLGMAWVASIAGLDLDDTFDRVIERLLELPEFAQWADRDDERD